MYAYEHRQPGYLVINNVDVLGLIVLSVIPLPSSSLHQQGAATSDLVMSNRTLSSPPMVTSM